MKKIIYTFITTTCLTAAVTLTTHAQPGTLDLTFGTGGKVTTDLGSFYDFGRSIALQSDGKIVMAGQSSNGTDYDFALARYNSDGTLDNTFGSDGKVTTAIGSADDFGRSVVIQSDGKILVAGYNSNGSDFDFVLVRYNSDGTLDNGFDFDGKVVTAIGGGDDVGQLVTLQSDDKIVVAGYSNNGSDYDLALIRYNSDGSLDNAFDSDGIVTTAIGSADDAGESVAIQSDGKIVVGGFSSNGADLDFALVRYNSDGSLDNSFGFDGKLTSAIGGADDVSYSVAIRSDGKIVLAGYSDNGADFDFALVRYNSDGSWDNSFGTGGKVTSDFGSTDEVGSSVVIQSDDKIVMAGFTSTDSTYDFALARYHSDGTLDNDFGSGGKVITDFTSYIDWGRSVAIQSDGKILVAGQSADGADNNFAVARYDGGYPVGITENVAQENTITISPNPFSNELSIKGTKEKEEIIISDVLGKEILRLKPFSTETRINTEKLLPGFYVLCYFEENKIVNVKLLKF